MADNGLVAPILGAPGSEGISIVLDKPRSITLDLGVMYSAARLFERVGNLPFDSANFLRDFLSTGLSETKLLILLTCGFQVHEPGLTMEQVGRFVRLDHLEAVTRLIVEAWQRANDVPAADAGTAEGPQDPPVSTGWPSGVGPATTSDSTTPPFGG